MIRLKVKEVAEQKKISQGKLSRRADVDVKTLQRILREPENTNIKIDTLNKLAFALNVHPCELLEYERDAFLPGAEE